MLNRRFFTGTLVGRFSRTHPFICGPFWTVVRGVLAASPRRRPCPPYSRTFPLMAVAGATWGGRCPCARLSGGRELGVPPCEGTPAPSAKTLAANSSAPQNLRVETTENDRG